MNNEPRCPLFCSSSRSSATSISISLWHAQHTIVIRTPVPHSLGLTWSYSCLTDSNPSRVPLIRDHSFIGSAREQFAFEDKKRCLLAAWAGDAPSDLGWHWHGLGVGPCVREERPTDISQPGGVDCMKLGYARVCVSQRRSKRKTLSFNHLRNPGPPRRRQPGAWCFLTLALGENVASWHPISSQLNRSLFWTIIARVKTAAYRPRNRGGSIGTARRHLRPGLHCRSVLRVIFTGCVLSKRIPQTSIRSLGDIGSRRIGTRQRQVSPNPLHMRASIGYTV